MTPWLEQLAALAEKATAGPWEYDDNCGGYITQDGDRVGRFYALADAPFVVMLRNNLSAILALGRERDALRACVDLTKGDAHMLKKAIEAGDPQHELLFRVNDIEQNCRNALEGGKP